MKQFKTIFAFEFRNYLKNKIFVGVTLLLVAVIAIVMYMPNIINVFKGDSESPSGDALPVMLISGGKDPIGFFGRGVLTVCDKYDINGADTFMKIYPGLRHEILNEDDYEGIYNDVLELIIYNNIYTGEFI